MFQFHKVRLKVLNPKYLPNKKKFQFHKVRLKVKVRTNIMRRLHVSIP